jgi:succinylglutamic semialdehyde dehydrogenase
MTEHDTIFINNKWKPGTGSLFSSSNPATGEVLWKGKSATEQEVHQAVIAAKKGCKDWAGFSLLDRFHYLLKYAEELKASHSFLATCISKETGKPLWESFAEVDLMINKIKISFDAYEERCKKIRREHSLFEVIVEHRPHGVLGVLGPYNFPGHLINGHIIPALLAGNTIVLKPSEQTPWVAEEILRIWEKVGLPDGVINLVQGGKETGIALVEDSDVNGILFTGSVATGKRIMESIGSDTSKILALEMGGNNPLLLGTVDQMDAAAYLALHSAYISSGQRCTCARRLIIPNDERGIAMIDRLVKMIEDVCVGPYTMNPEPFMGPVISEKHAKDLLAVQESFRSKGGEVLVAMKHLRPGTGFISPGLMDVTKIKERLDEEIFGPFLQVIRVNSFEEAVEEGNRTKYGLSAGLLSEREEEFRYFYENVQAGIVNWNYSTIGASSLAPFGGIKASGNFRPSAFYAADYCSYPVASSRSSELKIPSVLPPGITI